MTDAWRIFTFMIIDYMLCARLFLKFADSIYSAEQALKLGESQNAQKHCGFCEFIMRIHAMYENNQYYHSWDMLVTKLSATEWLTSLDLK